MVLAFRFGCERRAVLRSPGLFRLIARKFVFAFKESIQQDQGWALFLRILGWTERFADLEKHRPHFLILIALIPLIVELDLEISGN